MWGPPNVVNHFIQSKCEDPSGIPEAYFVQENENLAKILTIEPNIESTNTTHVSPPPPFTSEELKKLKILELKIVLTKRKLRTSGKKTELIHRLSESEKSSAAPLDDNELHVPEGFRLLLNGSNSNLK